MNEDEVSRREGKEPVEDLDDDLIMISDEEYRRRLEEAGEVEAGVLMALQMSCPHLSHCTVDALCLPRPEAICESCHDKRENWCCLTCGKVQCGRYVRGHMIQHNKATNHALVIGFSDLSVWCSVCEVYLNAALIRELRPAFEVLHKMKHGEFPPSVYTILGPGPS
eukprot:TRINITY_DN22443_c0_g2_i1.p1 TRINITY_DN22443_c0_g2~~TRINITY_DN22443_c0_g2_i1.p1  ORF type:complete len:166 (+),score=25.72 TRINITY_DN22443_c0_g2_i1:226-723(+)